MALRPKPHRAHITSSAVLWATRAAWVVTAIVGGRAVGTAVADRSDTVQLVATIGAWGGWAVGALALAVPSTVALTVVRAVVPGALVVAAATGMFGAPPGDVLALTLPTVVTSVLVGSAEVGRAYVQASAYGDERRFGLRPPLGYLAATGVTWLVWSVAVVAAPMTAAARAWVPAAVAGVVAVAGALTLPMRWHQLSRRWVVLLPAGFVVHDPVVLGETLMVARRHVAAVRPAPLGAGATDAADLTGPTPGLAVEVTLSEAATVLLAPRRDRPRGTAIHVESFLISPTRPGAVLEAANATLGRLA